MVLWARGVDILLMLETLPTRYEVVRGQNNYLWLEALEGEHAGAQVSVPRRDAAYDTDIQRRVADLSAGDVCEATLRHDPMASRDWRIASVAASAGQA